MKYVPPIGGAADAPYVDGNPTAGIKGSPVAAAAIEHPMREIMAVITEAGLTPDEENLGQLLEAIEALGPDRFKGFATSGQHVAYEAALDAIDRNSLYAVQQGVATGLPADTPTGAWAFVHTMVLPGDAARTQLLWSVDDPDHPGWWRRRAAGAWGEWRPVGSGGSGMPIGMTFWWPGTTPPVGALAINDGPLLPRAAYPQLWAMAQASGNIITEAAWQAQAAVQSSVGAFSSGDGATTFRCPRIRDYIRGADPANGRPVGLWQPDDLKSHLHNVTCPAPGSLGGTGSGSLGSVATFSTSSVGGSETRPKTINWLPCIMAFDTVTNTGELDWAALAATLAGKVDRSDWTGSFGSTGWRKHPDGTIEQWGKVTTASGAASVTFPIAFPNAVYTVLLTDGVAATPQGAYIFSLGGDPSLTGFTVKVQTDAGASAADTAFWRAWGK